MDNNPVAWDVYEHRVYGAPGETKHRVLWVEHYTLPNGTHPDLDQLLESASKKGGIDGGAKTIHIRPLCYKETLVKSNPTMDLETPEDWRYLCEHKVLSTNFIRKFQDQLDWIVVSRTQQLPESFISEFRDKVNWTYISTFQQLSEPFIREFQDEVDWGCISQNQYLSENFIREFQDRVEWISISSNQQLSENFIREFKDRVHWYSISLQQTLSEDFIREFQDKVNWTLMSSKQKLSESFIREFQDRLTWYSISKHQKLSVEFIEEFKDKVSVEIQQKSNWDTRSLEDKRVEMQDYATKHQLEFKDDILYAFRDHDTRNNGYLSTSVFYFPGHTYRDWHCDLNPENENSFGLGIWPRGNTPVHVKVEDWGCAVNPDPNGKARVWGFSM